MEVIIIVIIILIQIYSFIRTRLSIKRLEQSFPSGEGYQSLRCSVADEVLLGGQVDAVLNDVQAGRMPETHFMLAQTPVSLIRANAARDTMFGTLTYNINKYILRCRSVAPDFETVEHIVEREYQQLKSDIEETMTVPLYLGLLGTLAGIVIGLWKIDLKGDLSNIETLLSGVKWAMIASAMGLLLTTLNSSWFYRRAAQVTATNKNRFYTFLQTELLPAATETDLAAVVLNMQKNLDLFNTRFKDNIVGFDQSMSSVFENTKVQRDFLKRLEEVDYQKIVQGNIEVFSKMQGAVDQFDKFANYMTSLNANLQIANSLSGKMDALATRADEAGLSFGKVASEIDARLNTSNELLLFLKSHFSELDERKSIVAKAIIQFDDFLNKSFQQLEQTTIERSVAIKDNALKQENLMIDALRANRGQFAQLENLQPIKEQMNLLFQQTVALRTSLESVDELLKTTNLTLQNATNEGNPNNIFVKIKRLFGK